MRSLRYPSWALRPVVVAGAAALTVIPFVFVPPADAAEMPYGLDEFSRVFLTDADIQALAPWGQLVPDTPQGKECADQQGGGYACLRVYPISLYGYSRPHVLSARTFTAPAAAEAAFGQALAANRAKAVNMLSVTPSEFSIEWYPDALHRVVTSGRWDRNHYVEASCSGRLTPGPPVADVNTCTQMLLNSQVPRLAPFESPKIVVPGAPSGVLSSVKGAQASVTWLAPEVDGGAPITQYTATSSTGGLACTAVPTAGLIQTCVASGANAGVSYAFTVTATNKAGVSGPSELSRPSKYTATASAPRDAKARATGTSAVVSWRKPVRLGGLRVLRYVVSSSTGGFTCSSQANTCLVSGLAYATRYRFTVRAINARGASPVAMTVAVRTANPPPPAPVPAPTPTQDPKAPAPIN